LGRIVNDTKGGVIKEVQVHCVPFFSIYKAIGREEIDLFVLDIEGHEVEVLHTIPWDKVNILVKFVIQLIIGLKREL
jgi:Methyltransferase FkbM domain